MRRVLGITATGFAALAVACFIVASWAEPIGVADDIETALISTGVIFIIVGLVFGMIAADGDEP